MFNRAKRGEMRHPLVQSDTVKTLVEYYGIQFRRQIEWNLGEIALLSTARALEKRRFTKKKNWERELVPKFSFGEDLHRRSSRGSRGADVRLGDDSGANKGGNCERHFYYLCCVCVYEVFSLRVWTLKRAFRKRLKTLLLLRWKSRFGCCCFAWFLSRVFLPKDGLILRRRKKMPLGRG